MDIVEHMQSNISTSPPVFPLLRRCAFHAPRLCDYLFDLSSRFNRFYEECPVNAAETLELKRSRTALCGVTADVLKLGLGLLGIGTLDRL